MKINCVSCGHKVDLDDAYDDYAGQIKCFVCSAVLEIRIEAGKPKSVSLARPQIEHTGVESGAPVRQPGLNYA